MVCPAARFNSVPCPERSAGHIPAAHIRCSLWKRDMHRVPIPSTQSDLECLSSTGGMGSGSGGAGTGAAWQLHRLDQKSQFLAPESDFLVH